MMTKEEFYEKYYTLLSIDNYKDDKVGISGCVMFDEVYAFGITIIDGDDRHFQYLSMTSPEILYKVDDYKLTKDDLNELMYILTHDHGWEKLIESMHLCIISDDLTDDYIKIDFNKIPSCPPDYTTMKIE